MKKYLFILFSIPVILSTSSASCQTDPYRLGAVEFSEKIQSTEGAIIIDVRTPGEYAEGHIPHAINIDWLGNDFDQQIVKLDTSKPIFIYCLSGRRSSSAASKMREKGFKQVYELEGGIIKWQEAKLPEATVKRK